jgi:hypothetical protein
MLNFRIIYSKDNFELPISQEISIMELKMSIMGILDLDMENFSVNLEKIGEIDMEEMLELPLSSLDLCKKNLTKIY